MTEQVNPTNEENEAVVDAAVEAVEAEVVEELVVEAVTEEVVEEVVAEAVTEEIVAEVVAEAVTEEIVEELVAEAVAEEVVEELVAEAVAEEVVEEVIAEAVVEEAVAAVVEAEELPLVRKVAGPQLYVARDRPGRVRRIGNDVRLADIDYRNIPLLSRFLDPRGRIIPRRKTRVSAKVQRRVVTAVKRARHLALLPYTGEHIRITRKRG